MDLIIGRSGFGKSYRTLVNLEAAIAHPIVARPGTGMTYRRVKPSKAAKKGRK